MLYQFNLSFSLSLLFMGFLFANIFGIITSTKNIVFVFILCIELINYFVYTRTRTPKGGNGGTGGKSYFWFKVRRNQKYSLLRHERKPKVFLSPIPLTRTRTPEGGKEGGTGYATTEVKNRFSLTKTFNSLLVFLRKTFVFFFEKPFPFSFFSYIPPVSRTPLPRRGIKGYRYFEEIKVGSPPLQNTFSTITLSYVFTILNFLKIGFEFGFFVDAFKLGS